MNARNTTIRDKHRKVIAKDQPPCGICGEPIDYDLPHTDQWSYVVDHITPWNASHDDSLANKQAAHKYCNRIKSDNDTDAFDQDWMHVDPATW